MVLLHDKLKQIAEKSGNANRGCTGGECAGSSGRPGWATSGTSRWSTGLSSVVAAGRGRGSVGSRTGMAVLLTTDDTTAIQRDTHASAHQFSVTTWEDVERSTNQAELSEGNTILYRVSKNGGGKGGRRKREDIPIERTTEIKTATNVVQIRKRDIAQIRVAGNRNPTLHILKRRQIHGSHGGVADDTDVLGVGEVGSAEVEEGIVVQSQQTVQPLQRRDREFTDVPRGDVAGLQQVGELDVQRFLVADERDGTGGVGEGRDVDAVDVLVLGDLEGAGRLEGDAVDGRQGGVGDVDLVGLGDALGETELLQDRQRDEVEPADGSEAVERQAPQLGQTLQVEDAADGAELIGGEGSDRAIEGGQVAGDLLDAVDGQITRCFGDDINRPIQSLTTGQLVQITLPLNDNRRTRWAS